MRVATWNVNSIKARLPYLLEWLALREPDIVCLQELKLADQAFPHDAVAGAGYRALAHGQPRWNGVALLARDEIELTQVGLPGAPEAGARLIGARAGDLEVVSVYVPNGKDLDHPDYLVKLRWLEALASFVQARHDQGTSLLVAGDFNVTPTDLDTHAADALRGEIHHSGPERAALERLGRLGLTDLYREVYPTEPGFTWWDYRAGSFHRNLGLRIDLLLGSPTVAAGVGEVWVDREFRRKRGELTPSDHAPVIAELGPPEAA